MVTLSCNDDTLIIGEPLVIFLAWNRENSSCRHDSHDVIGILDGFMDEDQAYYLQQLQGKHPTCNKLNAAFPSTANTINIDSANIDKNNSKEYTSLGNSSAVNQQPINLSFLQKIKLWFGQWL